MKYKIAIVLYEYCWAMSVMAAKDFFHLVALLEQLHGEDAHFDVQVVSFSKITITTASGALLQADQLITPTERYDLIILPPIEGKHLEDALHNQQALVLWLNKQISLEIPIIAQTTASALIAATGNFSAALLATHWAYVGTLKKKFPTYAFTRHSSYITHDNLTTTGSFNASFDALLAYVAKIKGDKFSQHCAANLLLTDVAKISSILPNTRNHQDQRVLAVQEWIEQYSEQDLAVAYLAKHFGFSERNLKRRFSMATGRSINNYQQQVRLDKAKKALISTDQSIKSIAYQVGYANDSFFTRLFKKHTGKTPHQWRRGHCH